ncbi:MAG: hypothetical protein ACRDBQ_06535 [Shewanella sp.]
MVMASGVSVLFGDKPDQKALFLYIFQFFAAKNPVRDVKMA